MPAIGSQDLGLQVCMSGFGSEYVGLGRNASRVSIVLLVQLLGSSYVECCYQYP